MITVYIGLGSNLAQPAEQIQAAVAALKTLPETSISSVSSLYSSKPMGPQEQPDYINAVACLQTKLSAIALLDKLQSIELDFGRVRKKQRWGSRILDLDILLYADHVINTERLIVPHYGMKVREFVIYPLVEINPSLILPDGSKIIELKEALADNGLFILAELNY